MAAFSTFLQLGRGMDTLIIPLFIFDNNLSAEVDEEAWKRRVLNGVDEAILQMKPKRADLRFYYEDETSIENLIAEDSELGDYLSALTFTSTSTERLDDDPQVAAEQIVRLTLTNDYVDEDVLDHDRLDWDAVWASLDAVPTRIPVGEKVYGKDIYNNLGVYTYAGIRPQPGNPGMKSSTLAAPEEEVVPVAYMDAHEYELEVHPLPHSYAVRSANKWWARPVNTPKKEYWGKTEADALLAAKFAAAVADYWA